MISKLTWGCYKDPIDMPVFGFKIYFHNPIYAYHILNEDGSLKQIGKYKSIEFRIRVWNSIYYMELPYKSVKLPKKIPKRKRIK